MSEQLFERAKKVIPGGVNSPVRAYGIIGMPPPFITRGKGAYLYDTEKHAYIDYVCSWGATILGHAPVDVAEKISATLLSGFSFGAPTELETEMAETICALMPSIEQVRLVNSGTEAAMSAIRLARGHTGRDKIVKFIGCYHGHADALLVKAGSGALWHGVPTSAGVPADLARHTLCLEFNRPAKVEQLFAELGEEIAAIIVEPIAGNMNCVPADAGFLRMLRQICSDYGSVLIFDEVMSGFRVALGGAQALYEITPDLTILGKVIGGGLPIGAFGGKMEIMSQLAPDGPVYQAGTLSGNPVAVAAGLATLSQVQEPHFFESLNQTTAKLTQGLVQAANEAKIPLTTNQAGGMFGLFFSRESQIRYFEQVLACDQKRFCQFFRLMLERGIYFAPSPYEAGFVSAAHGHAEIKKTLEMASLVFSEMT